MTGGAATLALSRLMVRRFARTSTPWICAVVAALPIAFAAALRGRHVFAIRMFQIEQLLLVVLPAIVIAAAISSDLENRASTYLWSRPLARWSVVIAKLVALTPFMVALVVVSWIGAIAIGAGEMASGAQLGALAGGTVAVAVIAAGIAVVVPRQGMALTIVYMLCDGMIGQLPTTRVQAISMVSVTHHIARLAGMVTDGSPALAGIGLVIVPAIWLAIGLMKVGRLEA